MGEKDWESLTLKDLKGHVPELLDDLRQAGLQVNLNVPATAEKVAAFFQMFHCQRCGDCCRTQTTDGIILLQGEANRIADYLNVSHNEFKNHYTFTISGTRRIKHPCPFLDNTQSLPTCRIFPVWPTACRLFPVNTPAKDKNLYCNPTCPAGRETASRILEFQAQIASQFEGGFTI